MALSSVCSCLADLSGADPEQLCTLLSEYGIKTTGFIPEKWSNRPMCYTESEPARIENKYQFSFVCNYSPQDARGREGCIAKHRELQVVA